MRSTFVWRAVVSALAFLPFAAFLTTSANALPPVQRWVAESQLATGAIAQLPRKRGMVVDPAGNTFVTAMSSGLAGGAFDYLTQKFDANGTFIWSARYNGPANNTDVPSALALDAAGDVVVTGSSVGANSAKDYAVVKYDGTTGAEIWAARFNGPGNGDDFSTGLAIDPAGDVIVTGQSAGISTGSNYVTIKYFGATGAQLWAARYVGPMGSDTANAVAVNGSGEVFVTGSSGGRLTLNLLEEFDYATVKYAGATGAELWVSRYNRTSRDGAIDLAVDAGGGVVVTGAATGDFTTVKYESDTGQELWVARSDPNAATEDFARAVVIDSVGDVLVTGTASTRGLTEKYSGANGNRLWSATYSESAVAQHFFALALTPAGDAVVTGTSALSSTQGEFATLKYAGADGTEVWRHRYPRGGAGRDVAYAVAIAGDGSMRIAGTLESPDRVGIIKLLNSELFSDGFEDP